MLKKNGLNLKKNMYMCIYIIYIYTQNIYTKSNTYIHKSNIYIHIYIYTHTKSNNFPVHLKLTQQCKSTVFQLRKKNMLAERYYGQQEISIND